MLAGCAGTRTNDPEAMNNHLNQSNYQAIAAAYLKDGKPNYDEDNLLDALEAGKAFNDAGMWAHSKRAFEIASSQLAWKEDSVDTPSEVMNLLGTTLTSSAFGAYQGKIFEGGMIDYYQAINEIMMGNEQNARVDFNRFDVRMSNAVAQYASFREEVREENRAEMSQENAGLANNTFDAARGQFIEGVANVTGKQPDAKIRIAAGEFMSGVFRATSSASADKNANKVTYPLKAAAKASSTNAGAQLATRTANQLQATGFKSKGKVYVLYEDGKGPSFTEFRIDLPLFLVSNKVTYSGIALPKFQPGQPAFGRLQFGGTPSVEMTNITNISGMEFDVAYPGIVTKAVVSTVIKTAAQVAANAVIDEQTKDAPLLGVLMKLGIGAAQAASTQADVRAWANLPNTIQIAVVNRPSSGQLSVQSPNGTKIADIALPNADNTLVLVKASGVGGLPAIYIKALPTQPEPTLRASR
ncbi:hypothetical protein [Orrella daihaiensis]|uniref:Lipoprotein n=1 Tax=Orrella daihaiensis TaxID=2782176 RepID=A0ABY4AJ97_9BURK|nr:hypothetical protein [Orrella daihaiensis]UOD50028.1 hypothetical protein DHf2319_11390 [Orrella daihaiensis]